MLIIHAARTQGVRRLVKRARNGMLRLFTNGRLYVGNGLQVRCILSIRPDCIHRCEVSGGVGQEWPVEAFHESQFVVSQL